MKKILSNAEEITGDAPLWGVALKLALPVIGMNYMIAAFNFVDTSFAGRIGAAALAGISTGSFLLWGLFGLANLVAVGIGAVIARRIGEGNAPEAERAAYQGLVMTLAVSILCAVLLRMGAPFIFDRVMEASPEVTRQGLPYLYIVLLAAPVVFLTTTAAQIFQSLGDTARPMRLMALALAVTLVLDYGLMLGRLGMPNIGIRGAGVALAVSRLIFCALAIGYLVSPRGKSFVVRPHGSPWIDGRLFKTVAFIGLPTAVEGVLFPLIYMLLTRYTTAHGTAEVAALRVGHTVEGLAFFTALGVGIAMRPIVGQNLGARNLSRAARAPWVGFGIIFGPILAFSAALILAPEFVARLITNDPSVIESGARYLRIVGWSEVFMAAELVFVGAFAGAGDTWTPMAIVLPFTLARWPLAALSQHLGLGIEGVWWAISGTSIIKGVLIVLGFSLGGWKKKKV